MNKYTLYYFRKELEKEAVIPGAPPLIGVGHTVGWGLGRLGKFFGSGVSKAHKGTRSAVPLKPIPKPDGGFQERTLSLRPIEKRTKNLIPLRKRSQFQAGPEGDQAFLEYKQSLRKASLKDRLLGGARDRSYSGGVKAGQQNTFIDEISNFAGEGAV